MQRTIEMWERIISTAVESELASTSRYMGGGVLIPGNLLRLLYKFGIQGGVTARICGRRLGPRVFLRSGSLMVAFVSQPSEMMERHYQKQKLGRIKRLAGRGPAIWNSKRTTGMEGGPNSASSLAIGSTFAVSRIVSSIHIYCRRSSTEENHQEIIGD